MSEREFMEFDVVVVGAGPSGLSAAIKLKQLAAERGSDISVVVVEKGSEVGAHTLSGVVVDPVGLDRLLPEWRTDSDTPLTTQVKSDKFFYLTEKSAVSLPVMLMPRLMSNHGFFIGSLGNVVKYLGRKAEELGVEIYPGFPAAEVLYDDQNRVIGVATGDMGVGKDGQPKADFTPGMELRAKYTLFAEGARGSLSKEIIQHYNLSDGKEPQKFGLGVKELWEIPAEKHKPGQIEHSLGWPLSNDAGGGSFMYHFGENLVTVGFVTHLNYSNPTLSPFEELQRFKTHPRVRTVLEGGKRIGYGARTISEGGWQSVPRLSFAGGCLIGDTAGLVNVPRIKGSHNAVLSGILCAEHVFEALQSGRANDEVSSYEEAWRKSSIGKDLYPVRNVKPLLGKFGTFLGTALGGLDMWTMQLFGFSFFGTMSHGQADNETFKPISEVTPIVYPKPDGVLTFDRLSSVFLSNTNHEEDQPCHLKLKDDSVPVDYNLPVYGEPAQYYCPAAVYEVAYDDEAAKSNPRFVINFQNCVHCKTCDIKDPKQNITWTTPEGGGGPNYVDM
ncbi:electron transfer flavoprotein-ubiquinone oxidoreductase [Microvirga sp. W0021]|uniref:Electron transfer flavoprotein-ubiquinone oxidoreductase n=1 Tax=Hohaiivirga grylli TaxID=3133970 RepID=A0ABV0BHK9_9HYPH